MLRNRLIETSRLKLRAWKEGDFGDFYELMEDQGVMPAAGAKPVESVSEGKEKLTYSITREEYYSAVKYELEKYQ